MPRGLVLFAGYERRLLLLPNSPPPKVVLEIRLRGSGLSTHDPSFWAVPSTQHFYEVHGSFIFSLQLWPLEGLAVDETGRAPGHDLQKEGSLERRHQLRLGALCDGKPASAPSASSKKEGYLHINCLEMLAVWLGLRTFLPDLRRHHVLVRSLYSQMPRPFWSAFQP